MKSPKAIAENSEKLWELKKKQLNMRKKSQGSHERREH